MQNIYKGSIQLKTKSYSNDDIISLNDLKEMIFRMDASLTTTITDSQILMYRDTAISKIEKMIGTSLVNSEYEFFLPTYANTNQYEYLRSKGFVIFQKYINSIDKIDYLKAGVYTELDNALYFLDIGEIKSSVGFVDNTVLPEHDKHSTYNLNLKAIRVDLKSGLFLDVASVDSIIKQAITEYVIEKYQGCGDVEIDKMLIESINEFIIY